MGPPALRYPHLRGIPLLTLFSTVSALVGGRASALFAAALVAAVVAPSGSTSEAARNETAGCAAAPCYVSVTKIGSGVGVVRSEPAAVDCGSVCMVATDEGQSMTLVATAGSGSVFTGWVGDCAVVANRCGLHFDTAKEVTAIFDRVGAPPTAPPVGATAPPADPRASDHPPLGSRCTIVGSAAGEVLRGTARSDVICARGGNDVVYGGEGHDLILGGYGHDRVHAGGGRDYVASGAGADVLRGGAGDDELLGGPGADTLAARDGITDFVSGGPGRDRARTDAVDLRKGIERRF